jgi:hypothetical protein
MKDLPEGNIKSATFHFNCGLINLLHKTLHINYKDVKLGLIVYNVTDNDLPGEVISENEIEFIVRADHRGSLHINLNEVTIYHSVGLSIFSQRHSARLVL